MVKILKNDKIYCIMQNERINYKRFINQAVNHLMYELDQEEKQIISEMQYELDGDYIK